MMSNTSSFGTNLTEPGAETAENGTLSSNDDDAVVAAWKEASRCYILPILTLFGILFNLVSALILMTKRIQLKRSLAHLFAFLNLSDSVFLLCTFLVFCLPALSSGFEKKNARFLIPYLVPLLQTSLTISVYTTVSIAICGWLYVRPVAQSRDQSSNNHTTSADPALGIMLAEHRSGSGQAEQSWSCPIMCESRKSVGVSIVLVVAFGFLFNISRWFEIKVVKSQNTDENNETEWILQFTELRRNPVYVHYYSLVGSCIVMVFLPVLILMTTFVTLKRSIPKGNTKYKTMRIMAIIIFMFVTCHLPKVFLTGYEIFGSHSQVGGSLSTWPAFFLVLNEVNSILLVSYSAFNPLAYCGELIFRVLFKGYFQCCSLERQPAQDHSGERRGLGRYRQQIPLYLHVRRRGNLDMSEYDMMRSVGITLGGPDPLQQQLEELDAQSRIMCGLLVNNSNSSNCSEPNSIEKKSSSSQANQAIPESFSIIFHSSTIP